MNERGLTQKNAVPALHSVPSGLLQRKCACGNHTVAGGECEECRKKREGMLQRSAANVAPMNEVPPIVHEVLRSPGQPLDSATRAFMEPRFGRDFSNVRVHTDALAAESARAVNALAYTVGRNVVFGAGHCAPHTNVGRKLMAHELTHVVQQAGKNDAALQPSLAVSPANGVHEREAEFIANSVMEQPQSISIATHTKPAIQRVCVNGRWQFEYDGCSLPALYTVPISATTPGFHSKDNPAGGADTQFSNSSRTGPCDRHDECYQTCHPAGQLACDRQMYDDMKETCNRSSADAATKRNCLVWAEYYYAGLRLFGKSVFRGRQEEVCKCGTAPTARRFLYPDCALLRRRDKRNIAWVDYLIRSVIPNDPLSNYRRFQNENDFLTYMQDCEVL